LLPLTFINAAGRDGELVDLQSTVTPVVFADWEITFVRLDEWIDREVAGYIYTADTQMCLSKGN
jgi:hypothetical protein